MEALTYFFLGFFHHVEGERGKSNFLNNTTYSQHVRAKKKTKNRKNKRKCHSVEEVWSGKRFLDPEMELWRGGADHSALLRLGLAGADVADELPELDGHGPASGAPGPLFPPPGGGLAPG